MLDREQMPTAFEVDDIAKTILILVVLAIDELAKAAMRPGEIDHIDLHVMFIVVRQGAIGLSEHQILVLADFDARGRAVAIGHSRGRADHRGIEGRNPARSADRHIELHVGHAERDAAETRDIRLVAANAVAPRAGCLDEIVMLAEAELGTLELLAHRSKSIEQRRATCDDEPGVTAQHLRFVGWQVELAPSHIDPHIVVGRHQIRVARESKTHHVEQRRKALVRNGDVDMFEVNGISEIFGGAIECLLHDERVLKLFVSRRRAGAQ